jgi:hypothetical protein
MGIDPREGTLLTLVAMRVRAGWERDKALAGVEFGDKFVAEVARGLTGDPNVSEDAKAQARRIGEWAGIPSFVNG